MSIRLSEIRFNHDPNSATNDAINVRRSNLQFGSVPEWREGVNVSPADSAAAYAIEETRGRTITIQARFTTDEPGLHSAQIRAIQPPADEVPYWWLGWMLSPFLAWPALHNYLLLIYIQRWTFAPPAVDNVLGEVRPKEVVFGSDGASGQELFELQGVRMAVQGVGAYPVTWRWQFRRRAEEPWTDIVDTHHRIYVLLRVPRAPWEQAPFTSNNTQLPWLDVMDYACLWASGATSVDQAGSQVTRAVFDLGPEVVSYDCPGGGSNHYTGVDAFTPFNCSGFLARLRGAGGSYYLNCTDCATITSTFANILGCDLSQSAMFSDFGIGVSYPINAVVPIGSNSFGTACGFNYLIFHEVAWAGDCLAADEVFDACFLVDGDSDPTRPPHTPMLPANIRFGEPGDGQYRDRLAAPAGRANCQPQPLATRVRRWVV
ncbi:MAG: hypothetical protein HUU41_00940 [Bryobacteraceae bacterium]|nr:hypothetical protein [Bryobacterales bacterium]MEB2362233.1 hypothetical protein [Bryobacterales bacterium]NUM99653.1 hypothetical protein [Bryobacteraceae bacterium]